MAKHSQGGFSPQPVLSPRRRQRRAFSASSVPLSATSLSLPRLRSISAASHGNVRRRHTLLALFSVGLEPLLPLGSEDLPRNAASARDHSQPDSRDLRFIYEADLCAGR